MKQYFVLGLWLMSLILAAPAAHADKIYRWVDDEGVTHFTAHPPRGRESTLIRASTGHSEPVNQGANTPAAEPSAPATPAVEAVATARDQERCNTARQNLDTLKSMARIRVMGDNGEYRYLDDNERQQRAQENQKIVDESC